MTFNKITGKNVTSRLSQNLYEAACNANYELISVPDINLLKSMGIHAKLQVHKKYRYAFGGPVILKIDHGQIAVGKEVASQIQVREVS